MLLLPRRILWSVSTLFMYSSLVTLFIHGASQFLRKYSRQGFFGNLLQILILNNFLSNPTARNFELPRTKGPYTFPFGPYISPFLLRLATSIRGKVSSVIFRYVYLC